MSKDKPQDRDRPAAGSAASTLPQGSLGAWLRTSARARGVGLREIADASKISIRYLEALEHDRFEILPAPVFTRGFLREYSRVVGLDPDEVVNLYLLAVDERPELPSEEASLRPRASGGPSALGYGLLLVLAVVLLLGLAALLWWWARGRTGGQPESVAPPPAVSVAAPEPLATEVQAAPEPPGRPSCPSRAQARRPARRPRRGGRRARVVPGPATVVGEEGASPAAAAPMRVVLEFAEDCWMEYVVDGGRRTGELRTSGEVVQLDAERSILLTLGNVPAVRVEVDGGASVASERRACGARPAHRPRRAGAARGKPPGPAVNAPNPLVEQVRSGTSPELELLAAQGILPLAVEELIPLQVHLAVSTDAQIASYAASRCHARAARRRRST